MACPAASYARTLDANTTPIESPAEEINDPVVLSPDQAQQASRFRNEISLYGIGPGELRNAACGHIMFTQCAEFKDWKDSGDRLSTEQTGSNEDSMAEWNRFLGVAKDGMQIKSEYLSAL
ncbi:hypothetical protein DL764_009860 [Monosporascus ibericus]|uniref:Uncharacterized protein n=1 Tax=Monosporascus ibericus TaxID=155417 RepID=A0A4Q4STV9_9PEZI|nr:hypothetical protein DL764_009860 [Monosporascus ibericus]